VGHPLTFSAGSMGCDYPDLIRALLERGETAPSRGGAIVNVCDFELVLHDPARALVGRKRMSDWLALEEATQVLAGEYSRERLAAVSPPAAVKSHPNTAYGPRVWPQLFEVEDELKLHPDSRRAVVYVGRPDDLARTEYNGGEVPCTAYWQFFVRGDALDMIVHMRSNDAVHGLSYDVPMFTAVQRALATSLELEPGLYRHHAGSFHIYEEHWSMLDDGEIWTREDDRFPIDPLLAWDMYGTREAARDRMSDPDSAKRWPEPSTG